MKTYTCKVRGEILSENCAKCFTEYDTKHASRPECVKANITTQTSLPTTQKETAMKTIKTPAQKPEAPKTPAKTAETSPYIYAIELVMARKMTDDEIFSAISSRFPDSTYKRDYLSTTRWDLNNGTFKRYPKPSTPFLRIKGEKPSKVEKPISSPKVTKPAPKAETKAERKNRMRREARAAKKSAK